MPASFSKSKVDRAGRGVVDDLRRVTEGMSVEEVLNDDMFRDDWEVVDWWRAEHAKSLSRVSANLSHYVSQHGNPVVAQRLKRLPAIAAKLVREPTMKLSRMADVGGVRAILPSQAAAYDVANRLQRNWTIVKFRDYVHEPKTDGYRALHLINRNRGRLIEVQLRTPNQDLWANSVERLSRAVAPGLKFGGGPPWLREYLLDVATVFDAQDRGLKSEAVALQDFKNRSIKAINLLFKESDES